MNASRRRGEARYVADLRIPFMAEALVVRTPHAHARLREIDGRAVLAAGGVYVANAVANALRAGSAINTLPLTPDRILGGIASGEAK